MIPKSGRRFSEKIMFKTKNPDRDPTQLNWSTVLIPELPASRAEI